MSSSRPPTNILTPPAPATGVSRTPSMERRSTVLSSIKDRFSRKSAAVDTQPLSKAKLNATAAPARSPNSNNPYSNPAPTRRPGQINMTTTSNTQEPPPAYTPRPTSGAPAQAPAAPQTDSDEDGDDSKYSFLSTFDTIFLIDDSGSMAGRSWRETSQALEKITPICTKHDEDGIDIHFLNAPGSPHYKNVTLPSTVHEIFSEVRPSGSTPTGQRLSKLLQQHIQQLEANPEDTKPINIIVITDGVPSDDVESVIIKFAKKLDQLDAEPWQVGIQFFQVGEEPGAAEHLAGLDDELTSMGGGCRDIVDTVPFVRGAHGRGVGLTGEAILKVVLGAVNRRLDRRANMNGATT